MNKIEEEYNEYNPQDEMLEMIQDEFELEIGIDEIIKYLERSKVKIALELLKNKSIREVKKITSLLFRDDDNHELLKKDEELLKNITSLTDEFIEYLKRIKAVLKKENLKELIKFVDFLVNQYISNFNVLDSQRIKIEKSLMGMTYIDRRYEDTREEFRKFFENVMKKYEKPPVEKKKEI